MDAERLVEARLREVLAPDERLYPNVRWISPSRPGGPPRNGECDLVLVSGRRGTLLVIETKDGAVRRDRFDRWYAGSRKLDVSPFVQAETGARAMADKVAARGLRVRPIHAVAFPAVDGVSVGGGRALGPAEPMALVIDRPDLVDALTARKALDRVLDHWSGDGSRDRAIFDDTLATVDDALDPEVTLRPLLRGDLEEGERELLIPTKHQLKVLVTLAGERRASIVGGAGSGKTLVAIEKAKRLAMDGFNVLLLCFNQPLARAFGQHPDLTPHIASGRVTARTFHALCRELILEARVLLTRGPADGQAYWNEALPKGLETAIPTVGGRWQAVVVDEGQDFELDWLQSLDLLTSDPGEDVFYLFHDPSQSLYRADVTGAMGLREFQLVDNCRNSLPIHDLAYRFYDGDLEVDPLREDGRPPEVVTAGPGQPTVDAVRDALHHLVAEEGVERDRIAILTGTKLADSAVWRQQRYKGGNLLWNGSVDAEGRSLALAAEAVPDQPPGTILCETIHRFKGLEVDVVVLVELRPDDQRLRQLLYIGLTRAKHHVVVVVPEGVVSLLE